MLGLRVKGFCAVINETSGAPLRDVVILGIGMLPARLAEKALSTGHAEVRVDSPVTGLDYDGARDCWHVRCEHAGQRRTVCGRRVVSTIPLTGLLAILPGSGGGAEPGLGRDLLYGSLICVFFGIDGARVSADHWTYFPERDIVFGRSSEPANWSAHMTPAGKASLCCEVFCTENDAVCRIGYAEALEAVRKHLAQWPALHLAGRTGAFEYMNMDGVMEQGRALAGRLAEAP